MKFEWKKEKKLWILYGADQAVAAIDVTSGCEDSFEEIGEGAFRWVRNAKKPKDKMKMTVRSLDALRYWQVPSVN